MARTIGIGTILAQRKNTLPIPKEVWRAMTPERRKEVDEALNNANKSIEDAVPEVAEWKSKQVEPEPEPEPEIKLIDFSKPKAKEELPKSQPQAQSPTTAKKAEVQSEPPKKTKIDRRPWYWKWDEDVLLDGIMFSGERLRNCMIFNMEVKKDQWYRSHLTPSYVRMKANKLDADTPPEWAPPEENPLIKIQQVNVDGVITEVPRVVRRAKNYDEWRLLRELLVDARNFTNPNVAKFMVQPDCQYCHGTGAVQVLSHPDNPRLRWQKHAVDCSCLFKNPFKAKA